jgi:hypothetical protein
MTHRLVLDIPEEVYIPLAVSVGRSGTSPEHRAIEWLAAVGRHADRDPVEKLIGAMPSGISDWASDHDRYLGTALYQDIRGDRPGET